MCECAHDFYPEVLFGTHDLRQVVQPRVCVYMCACACVCMCECAHAFHPEVLFGTHDLRQVVQPRVCVYVCVRVCVYV